MPNLAARCRKMPLIQIRRAHRLDVQAGPVDGSQGFERGLRRAGMGVEVATEMQVAPAWVTELAPEFVAQGPPAQRRQCCAAEPVALVRDRRFVARIGLGDFQRLEAQGLQPGLGNARQQSFDIGLFALIRRLPG